jgi:colicin import membrane protein
MPHQFIFPLLLFVIGSAHAQPSPDGSARGVATAQSVQRRDAYVERVTRMVMPNFIFAGLANQGTFAEVEVRTLSDGRIVGKKIIRSSGMDEWDRAVLRAIDRTGSLPADEAGQVPAVVHITFRGR